MARMLGRRVWRGQRMEDVPLTRKHWRVREKRQWRRHAARELDHPDETRPNDCAPLPCRICGRGEGRIGMSG